LKGFSSSTKFCAIGITVLDSSSKDVVVVALSTPPLLCPAWSFYVLSAFTFVLSKILFFVWLFGATNICSNLEELLKNPCFGP
jgi:hypothetical protein